MDTATEEALPPFELPAALERGAALLDPSKQPVFDVDAFLCSRTRGQDVQSILRELREYNTTLHAELVRVINEEYRDFVELASRLRADADQIRALDAGGGLDTARQEVVQLRGELAGERQAVLAGLAEWDASDRERRQLHTLLEANAGIQRLRVLLGLDTAEAPALSLRRLSMAELADCDVSDPEEEEEPAPKAASSGFSGNEAVLPLPTRLERASSEYQWLQQLLGCVDTDRYGAFLETLAPKVAQVRRRIAQDVHTLLVQILGSAAPDVKREAHLQLVLHTCLVLESAESPIYVAGALQCVRDYLMRPWLEQHLTEARIEEVPPVSSSRDGLLDAAAYVPQPEAQVLQDTGAVPATDESTLRASNALVNLFNHALAFLADTAPVSSCAERTGGERLDLFNHVLWPELGARIIDTYGAQLFFVGRPDVFPLHYTITHDFLAAVRRQAPSPRAAAAFGAHETTHMFQRRWQLSAYFHIRARETVSALEAVLAAQTPETLVADDRGFAHPAFTHLLRAFAAPWLATNHLDALSAREWRLSLQVLSRYRTWLQARSSSLEAATSSTGDADGAEDRPVDWDALHAFVHLVADAAHFEERVCVVFDTLIAPKVLQTRPGEHAEAERLRTVLHEALQSSLGMAGALRERAAQQVVQRVGRQCAVALRHVRSGSSQYRSLATAAPEAKPAPSEYLGDVFRPLRVLFGERGGGEWGASAMQRLDAETARAWAGAVVDETLGKYAGALRTISRNLESLRRLRRGNAGMGTARESDSGGAIYEQMRVDVAALREDVARFAAAAHVAVDLDSAAWQQLREAAEPER